MFVFVILLIIICANPSVLSAQSREWGAAAQNGDTSRPAEVADSIRMTIMTGGPSFSPDGKKFVVVIRKGNLRRNTNDYSLLIWKTEEVFHPSSPNVLLTMSSNSNREAIKDVSWLQDNETLVLLGETPGELRQIYILNTRTRTVTKITSNPTNVLRYSITPQGDRLAFLTEEPVNELIDERVRREGVVISTQRLTDLLAGKKGLDSSGKTAGDFGENHVVVSDGARTRRLVLRDRISEWGQFVISPNGNYIVAQAYVEKFPEGWKEYLNPYLHEFVQKQLIPGQMSFITRFVLIDAHTGDSRILLDSPVGPIPTSVAWSPDSRSLLLAGVYLPMINVSGDQQKAIRSRTFVVEVKVPGTEIVTVADEDEITHHFSEHSSRAIQWDAKTNRATYILHDWATASDLTILFQKSSGIWGEVTDLVPKEVLPTISLDQEMNRPPTLLAIDPSTHRKALLFDFNPQFKRLTFGKVVEISWKGSDGHEVTGGLYYPVNYVRGEKYPLVIQSHGWNSKEFWIDGPYSTAFAAQALAAKGIMVVQADEIWYGPDFDTPREVNREVATFEGAIDDLKEKGLIDPNRVGIIGFSRTGMFLAFALTHSKYRFAAASVADSSDMGFIELAMAANAAPEAIATVKQFYGGLPYGEARNAWMDESPDFNWDKIRTPLRMLATSPDELMGMWGWFASESMLGKPVEMIYLPDGTHVLEKPWDRMISQQGNVDWFCFWLKGKEDADPAKAEQYKRWRELRKLQEQNQIMAPTN
jgi:dipeptidyl aminopeptidase/acylaminoacyl peptidase